MSANKFLFDRHILSGYDREFCLFFHGNIQSQQRYRTTGVCAWYPSWSGCVTRSLFCPLPLSFIDWSSSSGSSLGKKQRRKAGFAHLSSSSLVRGEGKEGKVRVGSGLGTELHCLGGGDVVWHCLLNSDRQRIGALGDSYT